MPQIVQIAAIGLAAGVLSALMGVGGGVILVPAMVYLMAVPLKEAIGTSLAIIIPTALMGVYRHAVGGNVNWKLAVLLSIGGVVGAFIGAALVKHLPEPVLRRLFGAFLLVMAVRFILNR